ncbi:hypothetical protein [Streptomyces sp. NPDC057438]|uniref:hypothetical protein n=1 Tax=Streptomyces sp. NPDC057438 TaxID=3346133 RepID=UPI00369E3A62
MKVSRGSAVLLLSAVLSLAGCSASSGDPDDEAYSGPTLPARTVVKGTWREGPAKPEEQTPYPYDINTHCGIKWVHFGGRWWVLDIVLPGGERVQGEPPPPGTERVAGYMTLIGPDTADFDAAGMPTLQFVPADEEPPGCA